MSNIAALSKLIAHDLSQTSRDIACISHMHGEYSPKNLENCAGGRQRGYCFGNLSLDQNVSTTALYMTNLPGVHASRECGPAATSAENIARKARLTCPQAIVKN